MYKRWSFVSTVQIKDSLRTITIREMLLENFNNSIKQLHKNLTRFNY